MLRREARKRAYKKEVRSSAQGEYRPDKPYDLRSYSILKVGWDVRVTNPAAARITLEEGLRTGIRVLRPEAQGSLPCAQTGRRHGTTKGGRNRVRRRPVGSVLCGVLACQCRVPRSGAVGRIEGYGSPAPGTPGRLRCAASYGCCKPWEGQGLRTRLINGHPEGPVDGAGSATCTAPRGESKGIRVCDKAETPARGRR